MYAEAARIFLELCRAEGVQFRSVRVLEIGCGTGFYTQLLRDLGVTEYTGLDITDVLFPGLVERFPGFHFTRKDVTRDRIEGEYDLILMIDVIEHIVNEERLSRAMDAVKGCLSENGVFLVSGMTDRSKRSLFYLHSWSLDDLRKRFPGYSLRGPLPFRDAEIVSIRKSCQAQDKKP